MLPHNVEQLVQQISPPKCQLNRRRGTSGQGAPHDVITNDEICQKMFDEWNDFHSQIAYQDFSHFWDKELFVNDIENVELSQELFIKLICDRVFLFLNYSRSLANPAYPNLMVAWGRELPDESPEDTPVTRQLRENTLFIREHGFMPTNTLRDRWRGWQHNIRRINAALERRTKFVRQGAHLPMNACRKLHRDKNDALPAVDISYTEDEQKLAKLFYYYLEACCKKAYCRDYKKYLKSTTEVIQNSLPWIHLLLEEDTLQVPIALWIWVLFTTYTTKLAEGTLKTYKFCVPTSRKNDLQDVDPDKQNSNTASRKKCNIILFNHLLDLLPPENLDYTKFQFYALSKYNRFSFYDTNVQEPYDFNCSENSNDFIDNLGGLIRYHIYHCLMNAPSWLTPPLNQRENPILDSLTCLLLHDSRLPPKNRLTARINALLDDKSKAASYISAYKNCEPTQSARRDKLKKIVEQENLHFTPTRMFADGDIMEDHNKLFCECMVLEFALRQRAFVSYYDKLLNKAERLFPPELFLSDHVFSE